MKLRDRYNRLNIWNKLFVWAAVVSIIGFVIQVRNKDNEEIKGMLRELTKKVEAEHPGVTEVRALPQPQGASDQLSFAMGKLTLRITLVNALPGFWDYRIDSIDFTGNPNLHIADSLVRVNAGRTIGLVAGTDACLVASVITLDSGKKIPWVGMVPSKDRPQSVWVVPAPLL